jgi:hypothetical protein
LLTNAYIQWVIKVIEFKVNSPNYLLLEECTMSLFGWLRAINGKSGRHSGQGSRSVPERRGATVRPCLERLEDRLAPASVATTTSIAVSITPNALAHTANETITATVTQTGTTTPVTSGNIGFNVNNQTGTAALNSSGQATFSVGLPLYAVALNQTVQVSYAGATVGTNTFVASSFLAPVYLNVMNAVFASQITFGTPPSTGTATPFTTFQSSGGETNDVSVFGISVKFNYVDPGTIQNFTALGITFPGSLSGTIFAPVESFVIQASNQLL